MKANIDNLKKIKSESSGISALINEIAKQNIIELNDIKAYLTKNASRKEASAYSKVIQTVLQTKTQGDKIILKDGTFTKTLTLHLCYNNVILKCLTNDLLTFRMFLNDVMVALNVSGPIKAVFEDSEINHLTVVSENFKTEAPTEKGFIQDYDSGFSAICPMEVRDNPVVNSIIAEKPGRATFTYLDNEYKYFGNTELCVICPVELSDDEIAQKIADMKYLKHEKSEFALGEKKVSADGKVKFLYQSMKPENFCPSYWFAPKNVKCTILIECNVDYNTLFDYLDGGLKTGIIWPDNLFYWDTIQQCFDFLAVFALTHVTNDGQSATIIEKISGWVDEYDRVKPVLLDVKSAHQKIERVFHDFINSFLNNSSFERYANLALKVATTLDDVNKIRKNSYYNEVTSFLAGLPFCKMINNQFKPEVYKALSDLSTIMRNFVKGSKPTGIVSDIRAIARTIYDFLPKSDLATACFPFIAPEGGLLGDLSEVEGQHKDPLMDKISKQVDKKNKEKAKARKDIESQVETMLNRDELLREYFLKYWRSRPKNARKILGIDYSNLTKIMLAAINTNLVAESAIKDLVTKATEAKNLQTLKYKKDKLIEMFIDDFAIFANPRIRASKKKYTLPYFQTALDMVTNQDKVETTGTDDKMEVESDDDEDSKQPKKEEK